MKTDILQIGLTYGPLGVAILLILFGHRTIPKIIARAKSSTNDHTIKRVYDWLHVSVWSVVVFMLMVGSGGWIYKLVQGEQARLGAQEELIVRGAFTKVNNAMEVHTQHGHLFSRVSRTKPDGLKDVHRIYNNMESGETPTVINFMFMGEKEVEGEIREVAVYCMVECQDAGLNSNYHREMSFDLDRKLINVPTMNDHVIRCGENDLPYEPLAK